LLEYIHHKDWINKSNQVEKIANNDDDDNVFDPSKIREVNNGSESNTNSTQPEVTEKCNLYIYCQMKRLESNFNPQASKIVDNFEQGRKILLDSVNLAFICGNVMKELKSFADAWNGLDPDQCRVEMYGMLSARRKFLKLKDASNVSEFIKLKGTVLLEQDWLLVDTAKSLVLTSMKALPRL
jgi:hypothetical protein